VQGRIIVEVLESPATTSELIFSLRDNRETVVLEIRRLHMLGVLSIIGISGGNKKGARLYDRDLVWSLSEHGRYHDENFDGCKHCLRRTSLMDSYHHRKQI